MFARENGETVAERRRNIMAEMVKQYQRFAGLRIFKSDTAWIARRIISDYPASTERPKRQIVQPAVRQYDGRVQTCDTVCHYAIPAL